MADVTKSIVRVLRGFSELSYEERVEALKLFNEYQRDVDLKKRKALLESNAKKAGLDLGPTNQGGCPCCGR